MQVKYSLDEAIRYIKNNNIQGVIINISCKIKSPLTLKVVGFYYIAYFEHNGNTITFSNTKIDNYYFDDGINLVPCDYEEYQIQDTISSMKAEDKINKTTAKDICINYYSFLKTLQDNNIKAVIMGHGAVNETLNWIESTLGYKLPILNGFNPFERTAYTKNNNNASTNSSCVVVIAFFITAFSLLFVGGLFFA